MQERMKVIYGIGTDLTDVKRIEKLHQKYGRAFAERILHPVELTEFYSAVRPSVFWPNGLLPKRLLPKQSAPAFGGRYRCSISVSATMCWASPNISTPHRCKTGWMSKASAVSI